MNSSIKCNGWSNRQTWNVALWFDNDEPLYRLKVKWLRAHTLRAVTAKAVAKFVMELLPDGTPDLCPRCEPLSEVEWGELAQEWREEKKELA
jgi:hypothetical protein